MPLTTPPDSAALSETLDQACARLLDLRGEHGHWEGELSSSALSTATAVCALDAYQRSAEVDPTLRQRLASLVARGRRWMVDHQNADGGWGDTTLSLSNISTTALGWAAFAGSDPEHAHTVAASEQWLKSATGGLEPTILAEAIRRRYGKDRTFSVPILTTLALTGRLGSPREAWRHIPQLPFELAACPHAWFAKLRLPVVSYALPALIAMGVVRHRHRPTFNPLTRALRMAVRPRTLRVLRAIQPESGGFLEAAPLTSFVALSLIGAGLADHAAVKNGIDFLVRSARADGSWPIDTNLATWVTTLSINALHSTQTANGSTAAPTPPGRAAIVAGEVPTLRDWLIHQQYRVEHPYTHAAPGGWAWTDLSGGVPDADDTPGALLALKVLDNGSSEVRDAVAAGIRWLLDLQNRDGGMPTFCRGWGALPFDRSSPDLTAHAVRAWLAWRDEVSPDLQFEMRNATKRAVDYLAQTQEKEGPWAPLWFGNQHAPDDVNWTYGTGRVTLALTALWELGELTPRDQASLSRAIAWLLEVQGDDGGWGGAADTPASIEETALAVESLCAVLSCFHGNGQPLAALDGERTARAARGGVAWLVEHTQRGRKFPPAPIGFYFAKLWYFERLYPLIFSISALGRASAIRPQLFPDQSVLAGAGR